MGKEINRLKQRRGCMHFGPGPLTEEKAKVINQALDEIDEKHPPQNLKRGSKKKG